MLVVRIMLWTFGVALSMVPLIAAIAVRPSSFGNVFEISAYIVFNAELIFMCVAVGAVAIVESIELLIDLDKQTEIAQIIVSVACLVALFLTVVLGGVWYGQSLISSVGAGNQVTVLDIEYVLFMLCGVLVAALVLKVLLWSRTL